MELYTAAIAFMKGSRIVQGRDPPSFLNVSERENFRLFWTILVVKSLIAGYGAKYLFHKRLTMVMLFCNALNICLLGNCDNLPLVVTYNVAAGFAILGLKHHSIVTMVIVWMFSSLDFYFQIFLDVYCIFTTVIYVFRTFGQEHEKAFTLMIITLCLDRNIDNHRIQNYLTYLDVLLTLLFQACTFIALRPSRRQHLRSYIFLCCCLVFWVTFKYCWIASMPGMSENYPSDERYDNLRSLQQRLSNLAKDWFASTKNVYPENVESLRPRLKTTKYFSRSPETLQNVSTLILNMQNLSSLNLSFSM